MSLFQSPQKKIEPVQKAAAVANPVGSEAEKSAPVKSPPKFGFADTGPVQQKALLSEAQVAGAKTFYASNKADFNPDVIREIQAKVGVAQTGSMEDTTVQAIAKFQQGAGMTADGKLGAKSLPKLMTHGLANDSTQSDYVADYLGIPWKSLKTASERGNKMVELINKQLKLAGVPECGVRVEDLGDDSGQFDFGPWSILVGNDFLSKETLTRKEQDDFANTVIHEARHAEQWFNMAQLLAGRGKTARQISDELGIPLKIAKAAVLDPIKADQAKSAVAKNWYESVYGSGSDHREAALGDKGTYEDYRNLPEESDAWRVGDEFDAKLKERRTQDKKKDAVKPASTGKKVKEKKE
jgi:peptidoglycan hydrolase-like protein with peptidoglycan-binding domain